MLPFWHSRAVFIISSFRMCTFPCYDQCYPVSVCQTMLEPVGMYCLFNGCSEGLGRPCIMVIACWCGEGLGRPCIMVIIGCCMFHFDSGVTPSWWMVYLSGASHCTVCENMSGASHRTVCENMIGYGWCRIPAIEDIAGEVWVNLSHPSAVYIRQGIGSALVQIVACRLLGAKPFSKPMLGYCQLDR